ncbi:pyruvate formate-lyase-activating protein [Cryptosporangium arvum]|uniref:Pyruvate formate-lyase-activating enzyme n=1 Tax=Cryptosporangium arvum DSM 44712 TaxID=927661 RepID=A0A010YQI8_9ACTN|nr:pyruvate formate-lyase-activating protein [Cryptosporangium arvum]EXG82460.1 pyruvate formate-lyase 1-activating enzyme [Cryptosporangium arvum DSM 44712]
MTIGSVHSWDLSIGVDGPGTRLVLFTAGCPLRCQYCENPDTWHRRNGVPTTVEDVMAKVRRYRRLFDVTGGGVTITGGEPLMQAQFTGEVLAACAAEGIHTALDTSGFLGVRAPDEMLADVGLVLLDLKSWDPATYRKVTGRELVPTLAFAERLARLGRPTWIRFVLVPGLTDAAENVDGLADYVATLPNVERVDVLAYHRFGVAKYAELGVPYRLDGVPEPTGEQLEHARRAFASSGLIVT